MTVWNCIWLSHWVLLWTRACARPFYFGSVVDCRLLKGVILLGFPFFDSTPKFLWIVSFKQLTHIKVAFRTLSKILNSKGSYQKPAKRNMKKVLPQLLWKMLLRQPCCIFYITRKTPPSLNWYSLPCSVLNYLNETLWTSIELNHKAS